MKITGASCLVAVFGLLPLVSAKADYVDQECIDFCDLYFTYCQSSNSFLNPKAPGGGTKTGKRRELTNHGKEMNEGPRKGYLGHRELITTAEPGLNRLDSGDLSLSTAMFNCQQQCMLYPRPVDPAYYKTPLDHGSNLGSDTMWCRKNHLSLVGRATGGSFNDAAFHCPHASPSGAGICRDVQVESAATPYEHLRAGQSTRHHVGYCDLAADDTVADCTQMYITDETLPYALGMLPSTVKYLFLMANTDITKLPASIFEKNLKNPSGLLALYMDECDVASIDPKALSGLSNLAVFTVSMNNITELPDGLFAPTPLLRQFSMFTSGSKLYSLTSLPADLFSYTPSMESILIYGHTELSQFPQNIFKGLTKCTIISFVGCGFTNSGFPSGVFSDLQSLLFFDFFGNKLTSVEKGWFDGGYGKNIIRLALWGNQISSIEKGAFDTLESLEMMYLHGNSETLTIDPDLLQGKPYLTHVTLG